MQKLTNKTSNDLIVRRKRHPGGKRKQKLIICHGTLNGGKTMLYNLFRKEPFHICLDISIDHYGIYKQEMINRIGKANTLRLKSAMEGTAIFEPRKFLQVLGELMKDFPMYNFVVKPGYFKIGKLQKEKNPEWLEDIRKFTPLEPEDIYPFYVVRHPKMSWVTIGYHERHGTRHFLDNWKHEDVMKCLESHIIIKVEEFKNYDILKSMIKNVNLDINPWTDFDLPYKETNTYEKLESDFELIDNELDYLYKYLDYDKNHDEAINEFLLTEPNPFKRKVK